MELKIEEMEIEVKKYKLQELSTDDFCEIGALIRKNEANANKQMIIRSVIEPKNIDLKKLPSRIGNKLIAKILELNGLSPEGFMGVPEVLPKKASGK